MDPGRPSTSANPEMSPTSENLGSLSTSVDLALPSTSVDLALPSTLASLKLPRPMRHLTFRLSPPPEDKCREVGVYEQSLSRDLEQKRQEVLWFHGGGVMAIPTTKSGVMYIEDLDLAQFQQGHKYETYY